MTASVQPPRARARRLTGRLGADDRQLAAAIGLAAGVGVLSALVPLVGLGAAGAVVALVVLRRWRDAVPAVSIALVYSNAVVILAQRGTVPTAAGALLLAALVLPILRTAVRERAVATLAPSLALALVFAAMQCASALFSSAPDVAQAEVKTSLSEGLALFVLVTFAVVHTRTLTSVVNALLLVGAFVGLLSVVQHLTADYTNSFYGFAQVSNAVIPGGSGLPTDAQPRLDGNIGETNRYGQVLAVLLPLAAARFASARSLLPKVATTVAAGLIAGGIVFTYSRGTAVALVATLVTVTALRWVRVRWLAAGLLVIAVVAVSTPGYAERLSSLTGISGATQLQGSSTAADNAVRGRTTEVLAALLAFEDHPLLGVGPGVFPLVYPQYAAQVGIRPRLEEREAHNLYAGIAAETGVLGLGAFLLMLGRLLTALAAAARAWAPVDAGRSRLARGYFGSVLVYAYSGMFLHLSYVRYFWLLIALAAATARLPGRELRPIALPLGRRRPAGAVPARRPVGPLVLTTAVPIDVEAEQHAFARRVLLPDSPDRPAEPAAASLPPAAAGTSLPTLLRHRRARRALTRSRAKRPTTDATTGATSGPPTVVPLVPATLREGPRAAARRRLGSGAVVSWGPDWPVPGSVLADIADMAGLTFPEPSARLGSGGTLVTAGLCDGEPVVLRVFPADQWSRHQHAIGTLAHLERSATALAPRLVAAGAHAAVSWSVETRLPGRRPSYLSKGVYTDATTFLLALPLAPWPADARVFPGLPADLAARLGSFGARTAAVWHDAPPVGVHGDFWAGNLLTVRGRLTGVVDWDAYRTGAVPGVDLIHLVATAERLERRRGMGAELLSRPWTRNPLRRLGTRYFAQIGTTVDEDRWRAAAVDWWLGQVADTLRRTPHLAARASWVDRNLVDVLDAWD
jgi:putative inorganic carbon (HCO3(-)) transporter